jgi:hypothetical protein
MPDRIPACKSSGNVYDRNDYNCIILHTKQQDIIEKPGTRGTGGPEGRFSGPLFRKTGDRRKIDRYF